MNSCLLIFALFCQAIGAQGTCNVSPGMCSQDFPCCSKYGFCGSTPQHCGSGCNATSSFSKTSCRDSKIGCQKRVYNMTTSTIVTGGHSEDADFVAAGDYEVRDGAVILKMSKSGTGSSLHSTRYLTYGRISADIKTSRTGGVVSSFILQSEDKDEIDVEWVGYSLNEVQTNWFKRGIFPEWPATDGGRHPTDNSWAKFHTYTIDWSPRRIQWFIDGRLLRQQDTNDPSRFPSSPSRIGVGIWDGSAGADGTRQWAGGYVDFNSEDMRTQGYFDVQVKNIVTECSTDTDKTYLTK
ncbi:putative glycosidase CRH2 [Entomophthora muscae]|uniref:Glycosidase CRH2 n=1 Tax=Entomophthora muscae TaxID=34485 RepID=A0ACC2SML5_9FUNG|nr:putative glycosidase CRH2 [Entomophthora muscae]